MAISINRTPLTGLTQGEDVPEDSDFRKIDDGDSAAERAQKTVDEAREEARRARKREERRLAHEEREAQKREERLKKRQKKIDSREREKREKWNDGLDQRLLKLNAGQILKYIDTEARMGNQECYISGMKLRLFRWLGGDRDASPHLRSGNRKKAREKEFISFLESEGFKVKSMDIDYLMKNRTSLYLSANISWEKAEVDDFIKVDPKELKDADTKKR